MINDWMIRDEEEELLDGGRHGDDDVKDSLN
jgi:hypothetical protein